MDNTMLVESRIAIVQAGAQGSGYLLTPRLVLTAAHVLKHEAPTVAVPRGTGPQRAVVVWMRRDEHCDAALLLADTELVDSETARNFADVVWGRTVDLEPWVGCQAIGYPTAARSGASPDTEQLVGTLKPGTGVMRGRYVLDSLHGAPAPGDGPSPWMGMSGAALFADGLLVGVASGDPVAWAHGRVEAVPVHRCAEDPEFVRTVREHTGRQPVLVPLGTRSSPVPDTFAWTPVGDADPLDFGVHRVRYIAGLANTVDYIHRDHDEQLLGMLDRLAGEGGLLLVTGDSAAGKSRSLFEAMRARLEGWSVCVPDVDSDLSGLAASAARQSAGRCVIWLDDLQEYLRPDGLTPRLLDELKRSGCVLLATMRSDVYRPLVPKTTVTGAASQTSPARHGPARVVRAASRLTISRTWTEPERARARGGARDPRLTQALAADTVHGVAEYLAAGPQLWSWWKEAAQAGANPRGAALVAAAVDLARTGLRGSMDEDTLTRLHSYYLDRLGGAALRPEPIADAWTWASDILLGVTSPLIPGREGGWRPFDYLVSATARQSNVSELPDMIWSAATALVDSTDWELVSLVAIAAERFDVAAAILEPRAGAGNTDAMVNLGGVRMRLGDTSTAEHWWTRGAEQGDGAAANNIGYLRMQVGDLAGAQEWFTRSLEAGETQALAALGEIARLRGDERQAVEWWRAGSEQGNAASAFSYAEWLRRDWKHDESVEALRIAAEGDLPIAALSYAGVLLCRDEVTQANRFVSRAYDAACRDALLVGNSASYLMASVAAMALGNLDSGRSWERRYIEQGGVRGWRIVERKGTESGLRALAVDDRTWDRMGETEVRALMAALWPGDCMDCGYTLGGGVPALHVDDPGSSCTANIYHFGVCRYPGWNDSALVSVIKNSGPSWRSSAVILGDDDLEAPVLVMVNPSAESVWLEEDESGAWHVADGFGAHTFLAEMEPLDGHTPRFIRTDNAPAVAQLAGTELYIQTGPTPWGVPGLSEAMLQRVRRQGGVLLVVTHGLWEGIHSPADAVKALQARGTMGSWIALKN
ncbi:bifunctional trypsin-like peptidase domain-containing/SEL1-like repeat protein [Streptomyces cyaneofuscatus]|uniref:bifunctional trypsin-like peptidase domain-containing/SEL1-like repeat protein n=1 Tax=Streptomyces cyaneofuscatus TaxID=66883 RepID=UPI00378E78D5